MHTAGRCGDKSARADPPMVADDIVKLFALFVIASMTIIVGFWMWWNRRRARILEGPLAIATVTAFVERLAGKGVPVNETRLRFTTATRQAVDVHLIAPRRTRTYKVGEQVQLRHDPADPQRFLIVGDDHAHRRTRLVVSIALATDAVLLVLIGLVLAGLIDLR
jgi:hypothetical protein